MEQVRLGDTGLKVSRLALGCMSYGDPTTPGAHDCGEYGTRPTPMSAHIAISSGSSWRRSRLYWFCIDTNRVQPPRSAACCSLANCHAYMEDAPRYRTLPAF